MEEGGQVQAGVPWSEGKKDSRSRRAARVEDVSVSLSLPGAIQCAAQFDLQLLRCAKQPEPLGVLGG